VKAPIADEDNTEYFWLTDVTYVAGKFHGTIGNEPGLVSHVKLGQKWTIAKSDIADWLFMRGGKMYGNYTIRPLLHTLPKEQAAYFKSILVD
jgi:uncharacterized protein YegJ (DUF2314 family)